jgi:hypothetical protein
MHVVYEMGRLCCIHTPVYYSKRLCLTMWPRWQVPSFIGTFRWKLEGACCRFLCRMLASFRFCTRRSWYHRVGFIQVTLTVPYIQH